MRVITNIAKMIKGLVQGESAPFIFKLRQQYETQK